jgi:hypothetical protein
MIVSLKNYKMTDQELKDLVASLAIVVQGRFINENN